MRGCGSIRGVPISVQASDVVQGIRVREALASWTRALPGIQIIRNTVWVAIWAEGCDKGSVLAEISRRHGVPLNRIMAVGDSDNDLPMLAPGVCGFPVAPANAEVSVKDFVAGAGGSVFHGARYRRGPRRGAAFFSQLGAEIFLKGGRCLD